MLMIYRQQSEPLRTDRLPTTADDWAFRMADLVPFGASWSFERVTCQRARNGMAADYMRVFVK
jgi:hypothetical protein